MILDAKQPKGTILLRSSTPSYWESCRIIRPNIQMAYEPLLNGHDDRILDLPWKTSLDHLWALAHRIFELRPQRIIFLEHIPHPLSLLELILFKYKNLETPEFWFHIYGDYNLRADLWYKLGHRLGQARVKFICASERQSLMVRKTLNDNSNRPAKIPFPINATVFQFLPEKRNELRAYLKANENEFVILYTGRISLQKNFLTSIRSIARLAHQYPQKPITFVVAGSFDDLGAPQWGRVGPLGTSFQMWEHCLKSALVQTARNLRIEYLGHLSTDDLAPWYSAADLFLSLSLHHDEDFGMSASEAVCTGLPAILTDWGGYPDFVAASRLSQLVPVKLSEQGLTISQADLDKLLDDALHSKVDLGRRLNEGLACAKILSIPAAGKLLERELRKETPRFLGFNSQLRLQSQRIQRHIGFEKPQPGTFYERIYKNYLKSGQGVLSAFTSG